MKRIQSQNIENALFTGKVIVLYGARRIGKTTLCKEILKKYANEKKIHYFDCEDQLIQSAFEQHSIEHLKKILKGLELVVLDEAQRVKNIGKTLKLIADHIPEVQVIATGSSSFELASKVQESLTGRKIIFQMHPLSILEFLEEQHVLEIQSQFPWFLRFGMYPELLTKNEQESTEYLQELTNSYLFRDIFEFQDLKNPDVLKKLVLLLAFQIGNEVSFHELSKALQVTEETVKRYIYLLEEAFIIFRLPAFSKNLRNEIHKSRKIYFWDLGVRNAIIKNMNPLEYRDDTGRLWENFVIAERIKALNIRQQKKNYYFWRNYQQQEIDFLEEGAGKISGYEIKWNAEKKVTFSKSFCVAYPEISCKKINLDNFWEFIEM